ncbi:MAG TPA: DNA polymerase IV [Acidimicrobiales bacterium]|nr:DNA polymerase IV [Acidimicrobiales bacterium]
MTDRPPTGPGRDGAVPGPRGPGTGRTILHVDMDAFFVSVELLRRPELRGRPVVVGGTGSRGVVAAASYEARAYGVFSAMPSARARRLCPHAVFLPGDHAHYGSVSERVMRIFRSFTPLVEPISLDEAFLDVTGARRSQGDGATVAHRIRGEVLEQEGLTCSVGVAPSKMLAKLASEAAKPRASVDGPLPGEGVHVIARGGELAFLRPLPARALWGVGPATLARLARLGVRTVGDIADLPEDTLVATLGTAHGRHLAQLARGVDPRPVEPDQQLKSVGHEETFAHDHHEHETLSREAVRMADGVAWRLRRAGLTGRTVTLKLRFADFQTITRSSTLPTSVDDGPAVARAALALLSGVDPTPGVRLLGVSVSGLVTGAAQQLSFEDVAAGARSSWHEASGAVDAIRERFGDRAIGPASAVDEGGLRVARRGDQQWGPDDWGAADHPPG